MWFFKQAKQQKSEAIEPRVENKPEPRQESNVVQEHGREVVHAVEDGLRATERVTENVVERAVPAVEPIVEAMRPLERRAEVAVHQSIEELMDKNGWWKEESVV